MDEEMWWVISVDDHVIEPPDTWEKRLPAKYRDVGPRVVRDDNGEAWVYENKREATPGLSAAAGKAKEEFTWEPYTYEEMRPGCYDPIARLEDMDRDGVVASLCFPSFPRFCGQVFLEATDKDLALLGVRAYNDFMSEEWCGAAPGRYIPMIIIPLWDPILAAAEIERAAAAGAKAIAFSENPAKLGLPSIHNADRHWDPVFAAAAETGLPLCMHIGSSSSIPLTAMDAPMSVMIAITPMNSCYSLADWLLSDNLERHPGLKLCFSEGGIGWMPYVIERCDYVWERHGAWTHTKLPKPPSDYVRDHIFGCFIDDKHGVASIDAIGIDNVMIETDYPHTDSTWPNTTAIAKKRLGHLDPEAIRKITRGNAERVFQFQASAIGGR